MFCFWLPCTRTLARTHAHTHHARAHTHTHTHKSLISCDLILWYENYSTFIIVTINTHVNGWYYYLYVTFPSLKFKYMYKLWQLYLLILWMYILNKNYCHSYLAIAIHFSVADSVKTHVYCQYWMRIFQCNIIKEI